MQSSTHRPGLGPGGTEVAPEPHRTPPDGSPLDLPQLAPPAPPPAQPDPVPSDPLPSGPMWSALVHPDLSPPDPPDPPNRLVPLVPPDPSGTLDPAQLGSARSTWAMDRQAAATFSAEATSVARARHFVRITAAMWGLRPETLADTELCMSELVGNAVRHTASRRLHCRLWSARGLLFVEVDDEDAHDLPCVERPAEDDECGRGMLLITTFAAAWGSVPRPGREGKTVWAAFPLPR